MIYYNNKKWGKSLDALLNKEGFNPTTEEERRNIDNHLNKGESVYFLINPFVCEMGAGEEGHLDEFIWGIDKEALNDLYYKLEEER
jgi:hypothetical protein